MIMRTSTGASWKSCARLQTATAVCMVLALIASCSLLPPQQSPNIYVLPRSSAPSRDAGPPLPWQLRVETPGGIGLIGNQGIVVMPAPDRITYYKDATWSDNAPLLVRERLIDAFLATHRLSAVTSDDDALAADFALSGDLRAFQSEYRNGSPVVVVRYDAQLRRGSNRQVLASRSFEVTAQPTGVTVPQVVQAFGQAGDELSAQVVAWTLEQGQQAWQQNASAVSGEQMR